MDAQTTTFIQKFQRLEKLLKQTTNSSDRTEFQTALKKAA